MPQLANSLIYLFAEIDAKWPNRNRGIDGWYRASDPFPGHPPGNRGLTHAIDVDRRGIDPMWILWAMRRPSDVLYYVIWDRRVWSTRTGWDGHPYTGDNPHTDHMHIEIFQTVRAEDYAGGWNIAPESQGLGTAPGVGADGSQGVSAGLGAADPRDSRDFMAAAHWHLAELSHHLDGARQVIEDLRNY